MNKYTHLNRHHIRKMIKLLKCILNYNYIFCSGYEESIIKFLGLCNNLDFKLQTKSIIKIISCILVVLMHTLRRYDVNISMYPILYYMTRCSMPLFFMAAGAIHLTKKVITYEYFFGKIKPILILMFGYYLIDCMVRFISGQIGFNNINEFIADTISLLKSVHWDFGVFWFLRTMIYIYLILPVLHKLYNSKMLILILFLGLICVIFDFLSLTNIIMYDAGAY